MEIIKNSGSDIQPVFDESGVRLFPGAAVSIALVDNDIVRAAAVAETDPVRAELWRSRFPFPLTREYMTSVAILDRKMLDIPNVEDAPAEMNTGKKNFLASGYRAATFMPLMRGETEIGALSVVRAAPGPLSNEQLKALKTYAAQAEIAIENARLLSELRESLQQQTAAAEVLQVISRSPGDLIPVFETILVNAVKICGAKFGNLFLCNGDKFTIVAMHGAPPALAEWWRGNPTIRPGPQTGLARLVKTKQVNQTEDLMAGAAYAERDPLRVATVELAGARTLVDIPLLKDGVLVGAIVIFRQEVRLFADKEIELLTNFAAQAVIAIENARLLNELRESLEQQTATSEVLRIVASSPGELDAVFKTMLENARHICAAKFGILMLREADGFRSVAIDGAPDAYTTAMRENPRIPPRPGSGLVVLVETKKPVQIGDVQSDRGYVDNRLAKLAGRGLF